MREGRDALDDPATQFGAWFLALHAVFGSDNIDCMRIHLISSSDAPLQALSEAKETGVEQMSGGQRRWGARKEKSLATNALYTVGLTLVLAQWQQRSY